MLDTNLIKNALALTGKSMEDMNEISSVDTYRDEELMEVKVIPTGYKFSIEKFCYYILSESFISRYQEEVEIGYDTNDTDLELLKEFSLAIYKYQSGNDSLMIELLYNIK